MRRQRLYAWLCFTCLKNGCVKHKGLPFTSLLCHAALAHAEVSPGCKAVTDAIAFPCPGGIFLQARADLAASGGSNGR